MLMYGSKGKGDSACMDNAEILNFLWVAIALMSGLLFTRVFKKMHLNFPDVTAFLIAGILIGPNVLGRLGIEGLGFATYESVQGLKMISDAALGFIAFAIGSEFKLSELKKTGKAATVVGIFQAVLASAVVDVVLIALHFVLGPERLPLPVAITMGAVASATAPAATLMVVRQYKADGPLTRLLLPVVALDDAVGLVIFSVSLGVAQALQGGALSVISVAINPMIEIICSLVLGSVMGWLLTKLERLFYSNSNRLSLTISFVLLTIALSALKFEFGELEISFSSLLVCMMLGTIFCNMSDFADDIMHRAEKWTAPLNACFFVLSGAELEIGVFANWAYVLIGVVYILARSVGKYYGARFSSKAVGCDEKVVKYLGITLLPQAGVALGMCSQAQVLGTLCGPIIRNVTLFGVLIYELFGPVLTRNALRAAGEIKPTPDHKKSHDRFQVQG